MRCGDDTFVANTGDYVSLPKGVPHALSNVGAEEAVLLQTHDAGSFLTFIRRVGIPDNQPRPDPRVAGLCGHEPGGWRDRAAGARPAHV